MSILGSVKGKLGTLSSTTPLADEIVSLSDLYSFFSDLFSIIIVSDEEGAIRYIQSDASIGIAKEILDRFVGTPFGNLFYNLQSAGYIQAYTAPPASFENATTPHLSQPAKPCLVTLTNGTRIEFGISRLEGVGTVRTGVDVTEIKRTESALRQSEQRFRDFTEISSDWYWESDVNHRFTRITNLNDKSPELDWTGAVGKTREEIAPALNDPRLMANHYWDLRHRRRFRNFVYQQKDRHGDPHYLRISGKPIFAEDGTFLGYRGTGRDITAIVATQERSERLRQRLNIAQSIARIGNWERDIATDTVWWSDTARALFGLTHEQLGSGMASVLNQVYWEDRERVREIVERGVRNKSEFTYECRFVNKNGDLVWASVVGEVVCADDGTPLKTRGVIRDISQTKSAEAELRKYHERLRALTRKMSDLEENSRREIATFLHDDVGAQLVGAKMMLSALTDDERTDERHRTLMRAIQSVDDALEAASAMTHSIAPPIFSGQGMSLLNALEKLARSQPEPGRLSCHFEYIPEDTRLTREVATVLYRSTRELLTNVARHAKCARAELLVSAENERLRIQVRDNGAGFDVDEFFEEIGEARFGLFSVLEGMAYVDGEVDLQSTPGQGTHITLLGPTAPQGPCRVV